ncbi:hypothetical protein LPLWJ_16310 [Lactiplantibacillus plantarum WJL]|nr:hypothetical protein LPLWJ_16310 [Lactiplantibacillus plantarum WJL]
MQYWFIRLGGISMIEGAIVGCALTALWFKRHEVASWFGI